MAILCGVLDDEGFIPQAKQLLRLFKEFEGRLPADYAEIEAWAGYVHWRPKHGKEGQRCADEGDYSSL
jgi:hypothetical protein